MLSKKQRAKNADWVETASKIEKIVSKDELDKLVKATVKEIKQKVKGKKAAYAWSGLPSTCRVQKPLLRG